VTSRTAAYRNHRQRSVVCCHYDAGQVHFGTWMIRGLGMFDRARARFAGVATLATWASATLVVLSAGATTVGASPWLPAHSAAALNGTARCSAHYVSASGSTLLEKGRCSGVLSGGIRVELHVGATFNGRFTFHTRYGDIKGSGTARPRGSGTEQRFAGTLLVTGGNGRYAHAHGRAGLHGVFDRTTRGVTAQTRGTLYY
jgi:hypothetical protein